MKVNGEQKNNLELPTPMLWADGWNFYTIIRKSRDTFFTSSLCSREYELFKLAVKPQSIM